MNITIVENGLENWSVLINKSLIISYLRECCLISYDDIEKYLDLGISRKTMYVYNSKGKKELTEDVIEILRESIIITIDEQTIEENPTIEKNFYYADNFHFGQVNYVNGTEELPHGVHTTYISEVWDNDNFLFMKIGKTLDLKTRMNTHRNNPNYGGNTLFVYEVYVFDNEDDAYTMENFVRKYYKKMFPFTPRDRFKGYYNKERDAEELRNVYQKIIDFDRD